MTEDTENNLDVLSARVIGCAMEVHRTLGPGMLESVYQQCMALQLQHQAIPFAEQAALAIKYRNAVIPAAYRIDLLVDSRLIVELKSVEQLLEVHTAQTLSYMRLSGIRHGLLLNFRVPVLKRGIKRLVL